MSAGSNNDDTNNNATPRPLPVSAIVIAKNEETNIARCLDALSWCDDIILIDDSSDDRTVEIAQNYRVKIVSHPFESFAAQRNWAIKEAGAKHDWILMLDADEVVTEPFRFALSQAIENADDSIVAFKTCRKTMLDGSWLKYSDGFPVWIMRITKQGRAWYEDAGHGEVPVPKVEGEMGTLAEPFLHFSFSKGMDDWRTRHERYSDREAKLECDSLEPLRIAPFFSTEKSIRRRALRSLSRRLPGRAWLRFCYQYIFKGGFLDGKAGWKFCRLMSQYEGMIVRKRKQLLRNSKNTQRR